MRGQKRIVVEIDEEGNCSIDGQKFQGTECSHFINEIQESLGQQISIKDKPEYRQKRTIRGKNIQKTGR